MAGARLLAGHWLAWLAIVRDVAVEPMVRFRFFFFYFKQPSKLGLGPGLGQVVTWVRLVRVVAVTRALAQRLFFVAVLPLSLLVSPMVVEGVAFEHQSKGARTGPIASKKSNSIKIFKKAVV